MKKFEYKTILTEDHTGGAELMEAGEEGWEAYSTTYRKYTSVNIATSYYFYLKREKQEGKFCIPGPD